MATPTFWYVNLGGNHTEPGADGIPRTLTTGEVFESYKSDLSTRWPEKFVRVDSKGRALDERDRDRLAAFQRRCVELAGATRSFAVNFRPL